AGSRGTGAVLSEGRGAQRPLPLARTHRLAVQPRDLPCARALPGAAGTQRIRQVGPVLHSGCLKVMERQRIDDEHIVARYLAGQLDEAEAAAFEKHYENDRDVVREIERTLRMKEGLAVLNERGELDALM